jgi:hypothetical protein
MNEFTVSVSKQGLSQVQRIAKNAMETIAKSHNIEIVRRGVTTGEDRQKWEVCKHLGVVDHIFFGGTSILSFV